MNKFVKFLTVNFTSDEDVKDVKGAEEIVEKPKFRVLEKFRMCAPSPSLDIKLNDNNSLIITKSEYEMINGVYIRKGIINGESYWFKKASQTYDEELGYYIYLADSQKNRWVISNGRHDIYDSIGNIIN